jgi:hypothetical protein
LELASEDARYQNIENNPMQSSPDLAAWILTARLRPFLTRRVNQRQYFINSGKHG